MVMVQKTKVIVKVVEWGTIVLLHLGGRRELGVGNVGRRIKALLQPELELELELEVGLEVWVRLSLRLVKR